MVIIPIQVWLSVIVIKTINFVESDHVYWNNFQIIHNKILLQNGKIELNLENVI